MSDEISKLGKPQILNDEKFKLGKTQILKVVENAPMGVYLGFDPEDLEHKILLPRKQVPEETEIGHSIEVFIYRDSEDRLIATTIMPFLMLGDVAMLEVVEVNTIGAFLNWGLVKDLFLPFKEQTYPVAAGDKILISLYIDKSSRLCATMRVYEYLSTNAPYQVDEYVRGLVYELLDNFGAFVAIDNKYSALIPRNEICRVLTVGESIKARVKAVRDDGKLTLSLREKTPIQMDADALVIMNRLEQEGGTLPFHDKSDPEVLKKELKMSKNAFKRAVGRLLKENKIELTIDGIKKV